MVNRDIEPVGVDIHTPDFVTIGQGLWLRGASGA